MIFKGTREKPHLNNGRLNKKVRPLLAQNDKCDDRQADNQQRDD